MKARVSNLIKTADEWSKLSFKPLPGEIIIYAPDTSFNYARVKIGDGVHTLHELPFVVETIAETLLAAHVHSEELDAGRITDYFE